MKWELALPVSLKCRDRGEIGPFKLEAAAKAVCTVTVHVRVSGGESPGPLAAQGAQISSPLPEEGPGPGDALAAAAC